ncbi:NAD-dependent protein deacetylase [Stagnimonas aquatica]|uniref:NAD-dependent protein deacetylase n=1 Tax=Stagnimonas aquatica TaxID=2689987 RepID=UPI001F24843B|nr:NAD-dependent protein deacetylase [Stagnimonas aquatica]
MSEVASSPLRDFVERHPRLLVLTGAGCSTGSGIPDYRDREGQWKRAEPLRYQAFVGDALARQRYWARSLIGWPRLKAAQPNGAHRALAELERRGGLSLLLTQNVDGLHQAAGSQRVLDLHGRIDAVRCLACTHRQSRQQLQAELLALNPDWAALDAATAPDGDADLDGLDFSSFRVPPCPDCGALLKPYVVFFGENLPVARVEAALRALAAADALLVLGSSLMVYSGYRYAQAAAEQGKPIAAVNLGLTRADPLLSLKLEADCADALSWLLPGG